MESGCAQVASLINRCHRKKAVSNLFSKLCKAFTNSELTYSACGLQSFLFCNRKCVEEAYEALCDKQPPTLRPPSCSNTYGEQLGAGRQVRRLLPFLTIFWGDKGSQAWTPTFKQAPSGTKVPSGNYSLSESKM